MSYEVTVPSSKVAEQKLYEFYIRFNLQLYLLTQLVKGQVLTKLSSSIVRSSTYRETILPNLWDGIKE